MFARKMSLIVFTLILSAMGFAMGDEHGHDHGNLEEAPVLLAGVEAMEQKGVDQPNLIGFETKTVGDEAEVSVFTIPAAGQLQSSEYNCHLEEGDDDGHDHDDEDQEEEPCELIEDLTAVPYAPTGNRWSLAEFEAASAASIVAFEELLFRDRENPDERFSPEASQIRNVKIWGAETLVSNVSLIFVTIDWDNEEDTLRRNHLTCHYHHHSDEDENEEENDDDDENEEPEIDCHSGRAGPNEPPSATRTGETNDE